MCARICKHPTYGLVVDRMNMELNGGMGLGPPSPPFASSSSSLSSFAGKGSVLAFLLTALKREREKGGGRVGCASLLFKERFKDEKR